MPTLQRLHFRIQELAKVQGVIPIDTITKEFESDITKQLQDLIYLDFIDFSYYKHGEIKLTDAGKLANIP